MRAPRSSAPTSRHGVSSRSCESLPVARRVGLRSVLAARPRDRPRARRPPRTACRCERPRARVWRRRRGETTRAPRPLDGLHVRTCASSSTTAPAPRSTTRWTAWIGPAPVRTCMASNWFTVYSSRRMRSARSWIARSSRPRARDPPYTAPTIVSPRVRTAERMTAMPSTPPMPPNTTIWLTTRCRWSAAETPTNPA